MEAVDKLTEKYPNIDIIAEIILAPKDIKIWNKHDVNVWKEFCLDYNRNIKLKGNNFNLINGLSERKFIKYLIDYYVEYEDYVDE